jgi:oxygen-independent coproporphyrinogen-3 oxidase
VFGIYIHWPFCVSKCPYCDFNSHVREKVDHAYWEKSLLQELSYWLPLTQGREVTSVFFGGGTPSLMPPTLVHSLISFIKSNWPCAENLEITLEANPSSVEANRFQALAQAGVNRLSLGIQALNDKDLKFLGRKHNFAEALQALEIARAHFPRFSFDLIYARPHQSVQDWLQELEYAFSFGSDHLSVYQLTIEPGTAFHTAYHRKEFELPNEEESALLFETTQGYLQKAGFPAYEISNHAKPGFECQHNLTYWRYRDYIGIGPGAHGRVTIDNQKHATRCHRAPEVWLEKVHEQGHGLVENIPLTSEDRLSEMLLMGLRLKEGISIDRILTETGYDFWSLFNSKRRQNLEKEELLIPSSSHLKLTSQGQQKLNSVLTYIQDSLTL